MNYDDFLAAKKMVDPDTGLAYVPDLSPDLFDFQRDITAWALRRGRSALFAGTGLGKSFMELSWADAVHKETGKDVLHLAPLAVSAQLEREAQKFHIAARQVRFSSDCAPGTNITNYQKVEHFDLSKFGGVILDECFAPDTPIDVVNQDGSRSKKYIKDICVGDRIENASGVDSVSDIHRREVPYAVRVRYAGKEVICSPNHPFFTGTGWKGAVDLRPGDQIMATAEAVRVVRGAVHSGNVGLGEEQVLREILLSEMADAAAGVSGEGSQPGRGGKTWGENERMVRGRIDRRGRGIGAYYGAQSNVGPSSSRQALPPIESHAPRTFRAWGQWSGHDEGAIVAEGGALRRLDSGICFVTGPAHSRLSYALQDRLGERRKASGNRGGWSLAPFARRAGPQEGIEAFGYGVDGVEVLELGHRDLDQYRDADGKLHFYDLGGTRHPSFSIHGALIHNSSILKSVDGKYRTRLIETCAAIPFRLAATATPAPNDYMELGNHAEFLGVMKYTDMLATFFTHDGGDTQKWRLKGHAENDFWKWMASWAVMIRKPSDLGYEDGAYNLPPLRQQQHIVAADYSPSMDTGLLFPMEARTMQERLGARRDTVQERVRLAATITPSDRPFVWWCNLNAESEAIAKAIPGAVEVRGSDTELDKERKLVDFSEGRIRVLVTKPSICGFGMNWQHCADTGFVGLNDSFEQVYQAIRRFWRFGQTKPVTVHFIAAETEGAVVATLRRKEADADRMAAAMVMHMADLSSMAVRGSVRTVPDYNPTQPMMLPDFLENVA